MDLVGSSWILFSNRLTSGSDTEPMFHNQMLWLRPPSNPTGLQEQLVNDAICMQLCPLQFINYQAAGQSDF